MPGHCAKDLTQVLSFEEVAFQLSLKGPIGLVCGVNIDRDDAAGGMLVDLSGRDYEG